MISGARNPAAASVPATTRWVVRIFLAVFFVCAVVRLEAWPLTGFRLFSNLRTGREITWVADTVDARGTQTRLWFSDLPRPYQGFILLMHGFRRLPPHRRRAMCRAWLDEARALRPGTSTLRIYRVERTALPRRGNRPGGAQTKVLEYACS
jgi:hypothetical protein